MTRRVAAPLRLLALLLAVYLLAPFVASIPQIGEADWASVDWGATGSAVAVSAGSATLAALITLVCGVPLGYWLARSGSKAAAPLGFVVQLPLALPPLTSGVLLLFLFGPYSPLGQWTNGALTDSFAGIVLAETFVAAPFLIVAARSAFGAIDPVFEDVAATLGHRAASRFFRVALPAAWPAIRAGFALAWLRAFGEFGATVMVAYHPYSLPVYTYVMFGSLGLPAMMPLLLPTLAIAIACAMLSIVRFGRREATNPEPADSGDEPLARTHTPPDAGAPELRLAIRLRKQLGAFRLAVDWTPASRRLAIVGPSGSGKSLALRLIAGLEQLDEGSVRLGAAELGALPPEQRQIGYMPQDYGLFPHMTVAHQLRFPVDADPVAARYWAGHLGLDALTHRLPRQLSLGQRQRVALARALTRHSHLLLFDEPFSALDTPRRRQLRRSLRALQREIGAVTVIVTHDPDEAAQLADDVLVIDHGETLQAGPVTEVFARPANPRVAELLGLRNVGAGEMVAPGRIAIGPGVVLDTADRTLAAGMRAMWRVAPRAIRLVDAHGEHDEHGGDGLAARIESVELRDGERHARVELGGHVFDVAVEPQVEDGVAGCRVRIDAAGVAAWALTAG
ncbi:ABC transporter ATP-binding protein/permease [Burkholderia sp. Ac-20379]|uniref:ABC transporter ATP-binding protein/permease n=1 Tax=Burkholderia sp. Ac-20379 TaxID=2703900 RepID=UPI00197EE160|nr:ATP-binding cassette domain-containing protein [Burkholderia sp. Ac-20379]MBN3728023.1 ATP-binding cassette domain-containing protein [Burkholderia sp. Ac-20379]